MSVASKSKLTQKQHTFATHMAAGQMSMAEAYRQSYDAENMKPAVVRNEASKLMAHRDVAMMIKTLRGRIEAAVIAGAVSDAERVKTKLRTMMEEALPSDSVKLQATIALGKSAGVFAEVIETREHRTPEQLLADIDKRLAADEAEVANDLVDDMLEDEPEQAATQH